MCGVGDVRVLVIEVGSGRSMKEKEKNCDRVLGGMKRREREGKQWR